MRNSIPAQQKRENSTEKNYLILESHKHSTPFHNIFLYAYHINCTNNTRYISFLYIIHRTNTKERIERVKEHTGHLKSRQITKLLFAFSLPLPDPNTAIFSTWVFCLTFFFCVLCGLLAVCWILSLFSFLFPPLRIVCECIQCVVVVFMFHFLSLPPSRSVVLIIIAQ